MFTSSCLRFESHNTCITSGLNLSIVLMTFLALLVFDLTGCLKIELLSMSTRMFSRVKVDDDCKMMTTISKQSKRRFIPGHKDFKLLGPFEVADTTLSIDPWDVHSFLRMSITHTRSSYREQSKFSTVAQPASSGRKLDIIQYIMM